MFAYIEVTALHVALLVLVTAACAGLNIPPAWSVILGFSTCIVGDFISGEE